MGARKILLGERNVRIQLEQRSKEIAYYCGNYSNTYSWKYTKKDGNQIRVDFIKGYLHIQVYQCDNFDDPTEASKLCVIEYFSQACPGKVGDKHKCVYKGEIQSSSSETVKNVVRIDGKMAEKIRAIEEFTFGNSTTLTSTTTTVAVSTAVNSQTYYIIPAGYIFCSFTELYSEEDSSSATGFKWGCNNMATKLSQKPMTTGRCTNLTPCNNTPDCLNGSKSLVAQPVAIAMSLVLYITVSISQTS